MIPILLFVNLAVAVSSDLAEKKLFSNLLSSIDPDARPAFDSKSIQVNFTMSLLSIVDLDMKSEVLTSHVYFAFRWVDPQLKWDPQLFAGITYISVDHNRIWRPAYDVLNEMHDNVATTLYPRAIVSSSGVVMWEPKVKIRTACSVSVTYFPFDVQHCTYTIGLWTDVDQKVNMTVVGSVSLSAFEASNYFSFNSQLSTEFSLVAVSYNRRVLEDIDETNITQDDVCMTQHQYTIVLKRKTLYYVYTLFIPSILISFVSILIFLLSPDSGEKISLGITSVLVLQVMLSGVSDSMPKTSSGVIAIFLTIIMTLSCLSIIFSVITIKIRTGGFGKMSKLIRKSSHADKLIEKYRIKIAEISKEFEDSDENSSNMLLQIHRSNMLAFYEKQLKLRKKCQESEWTELADTLDRVFFWVFCGFLAFHTLVMLFLIPIAAS